MKESIILSYDGSFNGFLSAVFTAYEKKISVSDIRRQGTLQNGLFSDIRIISTDTLKAKRVWNALERKNYNLLKNLYFAFLSEYQGIESSLYRAITFLFDSGNRDEGPCHEEFLRMEHLARLVGQEKQRVETWTRLKEHPEGLYFARVTPSYNVLPLVSRHFRSSFPGRKWLIYDQKRHFGICYNQQVVEILGPSDPPLKYLLPQIENDRWKRREAREAV